MKQSNKVISLMVRGSVVFLGIVSIVFFNACNSKTQNTNTIELVTNQSIYLGENPPNLTPKAFAPDIVSTQNYEYGGVFTPNLKEFYFIRDGGKFKEAVLVVLKNEKGKWIESVVSDWIGQPVISPDGMKMHLGKRYMERTENGWSEVKELGPPFDEIPIMRLSSSANGTYYFDTYVEDIPDFPLRYSRLINEGHEKPQELGKTINTGIKNFNHPFIAPDESYLIWDAVKEEGYGSSDLYISFKQENGSWGEAINLGDKINTEAWEASAAITPDGKYLFFSRNMGSKNYENVDIFWVSTQVIENLKNIQE